MKYEITKKGIYKRDYFLTTYLDELLEMYKKAKHRIEEKFELIIEKKYKKILFYGAGETGKVVLNVYNDTYKDKLDVLGIIDDDEEKTKSDIWGINIMTIGQGKKLDYEKIFITSFAYKNKIFKKLESEKIEKNKIEDFFSQELL